MDSHQHYSQLAARGQETRRAMVAGLDRQITQIRAGVVMTDELMTPAEVAKAFNVDPKTVTRWAKQGKLTAVRTLGGHRRYRSAEIAALLNGLTS